MRFLSERECRACLRKFRPGPHNAHSQKYCLRPTCVIERKRKRQNASRRRLRLKDASWSGEADRRSSESRRRRRERERAAADASRLAVESATRSESARRDGAEKIASCLFGLVAHISDAATPIEAERIFANFTDKGRLWMPRPSSPECQSTSVPHRRKGGCQSTSAPDEYSAAPHGDCR
jgi:hypothetical protein